MPDTKISALTAAGAAAFANEIPINDAGATKKITLTQIATLIGEIKSKQLGTSITGIASTTLAKATNLDLALTIGTWTFEYFVVYRSDTTTSGMRFGVNFSGTQTTFVAEGTQFESTTAASTGATSQVHTAGFGLRSGGSSRAPSTTATLLLSTAVDTINVDNLAVIRGLLVVTVAGNLELYYGSEVVGGTQSVMAASSLRLIKVS